MTTTVPGTEFAIREAERSDLLAVFRIEKASFPQPWPFRAFERFLDAPGFLVAERGGTIVGYVVADSVPNRGRAIGHVKDFAVHPDHRGVGVGTSLLQRTLAELAMRGIHTVKLEVRETNDAAIRLYRQFGFTHRRTVPQYYANGEDALIMVHEA
ncbi:ribosomal protein S18-alanine N-acetyltransferase [Halocatena pleomorpha]|uniref:Ribosomal-protein-alanine N-acetyltransferase n=1 Tax=Halocatena pleomorpha TaxID=1785090 RepID=A0A3P3R6T4_9EURY|nr:ribosomal protein S18-alanine N-acetyltransferase [Halocatena pleomorpha]RRJ29167.1 ribosomal-protein-alanine N-acetyltransferase [Halocatena pleomorpha]